MMLFFCLSVPCMLHILELIINIYKEGYVGLEATLLFSLSLQILLGLPVAILLHMVRHLLFEYSPTHSKN